MVRLAKKQEVRKPKNRIKKTLMAIAIALVLVFFVGYGLHTFYKEPEWDDYCEERVGKGLYETKESCEAVGGKWTETPKPMVEDLQQNQYICTKSLSAEEEMFVFTCLTKEDIEKETGYCNPDHTCQEEYEAVKEPHNRLSFIILAIISIIVIVITTAVLKENAVSYGVLAGGILTILYGTLRFWGAIPDIARFLILGAALIILIGVAYKKLK